MIRFIQRDEVTHLLLFQNMINSTKKESPEFFTKDLEEEVLEMFREAVKVEIAWGEYITQGQILGLQQKLFKNTLNILQMTD